MITAHTRVFAVVGDPIGQSLSPPLHNAWLEEAGIDAVYVALRVPAGADLAGLRTVGLAGANVTTPHKDAAFALADRASPAAEALQAANVLTWAADGALEAHNTDAEGFAANLDRAAPDWRGGKHPQVLILGAGGAARAIAYGLAGRGAAIAIANRTQAKAQTAAAGIAGATTVDWEELPEAFAAAHVIINATSAELLGGEGPAWPFAHARAGAIAADAVYRPRLTPFLRGAIAAGLQPVDGLGMLVHQGAAAFQHWFGVAPAIGPALARLHAIMDAEEGT